MIAAKHLSFTDICLILITLLQPFPPVLENPELTKEEPPSYDDAIELNRVKPPPQYAPPAPDENLPYPTTAGYYDPVHPPGDPSYQGYPNPIFHLNLQIVNNCHRYM